MIDFSSQVFSVGVYHDYNNKNERMTEASVSDGRLLATAQLVWDVYVVDFLKRSVRENNNIAVLKTHYTKVSML